MLDTGTLLALLGNLPYGSNTILFSAGLAVQLIQNIGKSGLTIIKMELLKLLKKWFLDPLLVAQT
jgi:hypothetical protein